MLSSSSAPGVWRRCKAWIEDRWMDGFANLRFETLPDALTICWVPGRLPLRFNVDTPASLSN
jgi:hypothetical protein